MAEYRKKFIALDLETTHLDIREGRIMEAGAVEVELLFDEREKRITVQFGRTFDTLVNPELEVSPTALLLTGIAAADLAVAPKWQERKDDLKKFLGKETLVGHNLGFDLEFLKNQGVNLKNSYLDSLEIAQTFVPLLPSHSLEFLAQEFEVLESASHRALADAKHSALVLAAILNNFLGLAPKLKEEIREFLQRSPLPFRDLFLDIPEVKVPVIHLRQPLTQSSSPRGPVEPWEKALAARWPARTVLFLPLAFGNYQDLLLRLATAKRSGIVGVSHPTYLDGLPERQKIVSPVSALCEKRWKRLKNAEFLPAAAYRMLIKLAIFQSQSDSLDLSLLKWNPDERLLLPAIIVDAEVCPRHRCRYFGQLQRKTGAVHFLDLPGFMALLRDWPVDFSAFPVLLSDLGRIEDEFAESQNEIWNLRKIRQELTKLYPLDKQQVSWYPKVPREVDTLANELDLFFGILHLVYFKRPGTYAEKVVVEEEERQSERFQKLLQPAEKVFLKLEKFAGWLAMQSSWESGELAGELMALAHKVQAFGNFVREFFLELPLRRIPWFKFNTQGADLNLVTLQLIPLPELLDKYFSTATLLETEISEISLRYFLNRLGLLDWTVEKLPIVSKPGRIEVKIFSSAPTAAQLQSISRSLPGRSLFLVPNETQLLTTHELLQPRNPGELDVLTYKFSGSLPVIKKKYLEKEKVLLLLTTNIFLRQFLTLPMTKNLLLARLPFEAPGTRPVVSQAMSASVFAGEVLPRAVYLLHRILSRFVTAASENATIYLLDPRILNDYDQRFLKYLEELPNFEISTIDPAREQNF